MIQKMDLTKGLKLLILRRLIMLLREYFEGNTM